MKLPPLFSVFFFPRDIFLSARDNFRKTAREKKSGRDNFRPKKVPVTFFGVAVTNFQICARDMKKVAVTIFDKFDKVPVTFLKVPVTFFFGKLYFALLN